ncbi:MAG: zinc ABC transporter substrate-binding protein [Verrucomicrobiota bacterium]
MADADVVIYSGIGYDDWMEKLLGNPGKKDRQVIRVADLIGAKDGDNPHIWYDPRTKPALADKLAADLGDHAPDAAKNAEGLQGRDAARARQDRGAQGPVRRHHRHRDPSRSSATWPGPSASRCSTTTFKST